MGLPKQPSGSCAAQCTTQARKRAGAAAAAHRHRHPDHHKSPLSFFLSCSRAASSSCTSLCPCWCALQTRTTQNFLHTTGGDGGEATPATAPAPTSATSDRASQTGTPFAFRSRSSSPVHDMRVLASAGAGSTTALPTACKRRDLTLATAP